MARKNDISGISVAKKKNNRNQRSIHILIIMYVWRSVVSAACNRKREIRRKYWLSSGEREKGEKKNNQASGAAHGESSKHPVAPWRQRASGISAAPRRGVF